MSDQELTPEEDCRTAVVEALEALADKEPDTGVRYSYRRLLGVARNLSAPDMDEADADSIYRWARNYWQRQWDGVSYGPYDEWTPDNLSRCYVKVAAVYDWRFGVGEWERSLGRRPGSLLGTRSVENMGADSGPVGRSEEQ